MFYTCFLSATDQTCVELRRIDSSSVIAHLVNFDIQWERSLKMWCQVCDAKNSTYICIYITLSIIDMDILYQFNLRLHHFSQFLFNVKQEIAENYEKYIRARDPFPWRSIHQNLNSLGNSFCSDSNLAGATLCRYNFCTWHETHICCQGMRKICSDDQKMKYDKMKF